jgi:hypothetical protein
MIYRGIDEVLTIDQLKDILEVTKKKNGHRIKHANVYFDFFCLGSSKKQELQKHKKTGT